MISYDLSESVEKYLEPADTILRQCQTVGESLSLLRAKKVRHEIVYFYVVDADDRLIGVVSARSLLLSDPDRRIEDAMNKTVVSVKSWVSLKDALETLASHRLLGIPVVDKEGRILGTISVHLYSENALDVTNGGAQDDLFHLIGLHLEQAKQISPWTEMRMRMPWLLCNIIGGIICAVIGAAFERTLTEVILLAMFIPLMLTLSESISIQAMMLMLNYLRGAAVPKNLIRARILREWRGAFLLGLSCAVIVGAISLIWNRGFLPPLILSVSIVISMMSAATFGAIVPVFLRAVNLDPKVASGPVVLMIGDVVTTAIYLGTAAFFLL